MEFERLGNTDEYGERFHGEDLLDDLPRLMVGVGLVIVQGLIILRAFGLL